MSLLRAKRIAEAVPGVGSKADVRSVLRLHGHVMRRSPRFGDWRRSRGLASRPSRSTRLVTIKGLRRVKKLIRRGIVAARSAAVHESSATIVARAPRRTWKVQPDALPSTTTSRRSRTEGTGCSERVRGVLKPRARATPVSNRPLYSHAAAGAPTTMRSRTCSACEMEAAGLYGLAAVQREGSRCSP